MSTVETVLTAVRGDDNFYTFDITGVLAAGDLITFRAARSSGTLTDAGAVILKTRGTGIVDVDIAAGQFQVQLEPADTAALVADEALLFHCVVRKADTAMDTTVARGTLRLLG